MTEDARKKQTAVIDVMARGTMHNMMLAAAQARDLHKRSGVFTPSYVVITEAGQTLVHDERAAIRLSENLTRMLQKTSVVVQLVRVTTVEKPKPAETEPPMPEASPEGGES